MAGALLLAALLMLGVRVAPRTAGSLAPEV